MIVETRNRPSALRAPALGVFDVGLILRRLDWLLMLAVVTLVGYGLWAIGGITRFDVPGNPDYFVMRQVIAIAVGGVAMVVAVLVPPSLYARHWRFALRRHDRRHALRLRFRARRCAARSAGSTSARSSSSPPSSGSSSSSSRSPASSSSGAVGSVRSRTVACAIGLGLVPIGLVFLQPDLGTALVYGAALTAVLFLSGVRWLHLVILGGHHAPARDERALAPARPRDRGAEALPDGAADRIHESRQRSRRR